MAEKENQSLKKLGIIRRLDNTGLGYQSRNLCRMLNPEKTLDISSGEEIPGFPEYQKFLEGLDIVFTAETPYVYEAWNWARMAGVKTFCQPNWELFDGLIQPNMPHPDQYLMPSYWHLDDMRKLFPNIGYLPPPTIESDFEEVRKINLSRTGKRKFVHIGGKPAIYDRNGWSNIIDALEHTTSDFELTVFSQHEITGIADPRVRYHVFDIEDQTELYRDFDALIMPRRYGGLCLPMNEALIAGLPVIMTDIEPNNRILPRDWLVPAYISAQFEGRSTIDVYSTQPEDLARKIDWFLGLPDFQLRAQKEQAYKIGHVNYSDTLLLSKYKEILEE